MDTEERTQKLKALNLSCGQLAAIPEEVFSLSELEKLWIEENEPSESKDF